MCVNFVLQSNYFWDATVSKATITFSNIDMSTILLEMIRDLMGVVRVLVLSILHFKDNP